MYIFGRHRLVAVRQYRPQHCDEEDHPQIDDLTQTEMRFIDVEPKNVTLIQ